MRQGKQLIHQIGYPSRLCALIRTAAAVGLACGACGSNAKPIELTVSDHNPTGSPPAQAVDYWAEQLTQQAGSRLKLTVIHDGALLSGAEAYRGVQTGVADAAQYTLSSSDGFQLNSVMALPFMGWPDQLKSAQMYDALLVAQPAMKAEWKGVRIIGSWMMPGTHIHNVVRDITTPADLSGLKAMGAEPMTVESARAAGAIPVELDIAQMASSLGDGTISAVINHFPVLSVFGVLEKLTHHTVFGRGGINMTPMFIIMNNDVFNNLPSDLQTVVAASGSVFRDKMYSIDVPMEADCIAQAEGWGHSFVRLTPEEIAVWYSLVKQPVHDTWIATAEAAGLPGQAVYDAVLQRIQAAAATP
jgi:TRAP-type C4-dicarboxylate transport system substrate-binding protein